MRIKDHTIDVLRHGPYSELILKDGIFFTPARLFNMGMMACNLCGNIISIEKKYCPQCGEWVLCIHEDYLEKKVEVVRLVKDEEKDTFISRFMANTEMQVKYPLGGERYTKANETYKQFKSDQYARKKKTL